MAARVFTRRVFAAMAGLGGLAPRNVWSTPIVRAGPATRLTPPENQPYTPPASLGTVADLYRRMTAPIRVDGRGPFPFIVDTGANQSVISRELADRLGLALGPVEALNGVAGVQDTPTTTARLDVGDHVRTAATLSVLPASAIGGAGMLGLDRLEGMQLTLDFRGQKLRIENLRRVWRTPGDIAVKARRRDGQLTLVDADLAGIPITAFLDSGAEDTVGNLALREMAITRRPTSLWTQAPIISVTGQTIAADMADLPALRIGGMKLPNWPVAFADLHTFRMWNLTDRPAILVGVDVLSRFESVCLDFARDEVRFRPPAV